MISIDSWQSAFVALHKAASNARGIELDRADPTARWPHTIGADVVAIAALVDPAVQRVPYGFGGQALLRRWVVAMLDVERYALSEPRAPYRANRAFWNLLSAACVYLDSVDAARPAPAIWATLLGQLSEALVARNVGPTGATPFKQFDGVKTFDDLFIAQRRYLTQLHGADDKDPDPGTAGAKKPIPRSTNAEVVVLADYWTQQLDRVKRVFGADAVQQRWKVARGDVDAIARSADPSAEYAKNNAFWRALQETAVHVAAADEAPSQTDLMLDALTTSLRELPQNIKAGAKAIASGASDLAGSLAHGVGKVANEAGRGLFGGFGVPLMIGGGLVGLFLLTRSRDRDGGESKS